MSKKRSLLERFEIDIEKLDYGYIESCTDGKELEKIYRILLSSEEGFYPDLTKAAERKLAIVRPQSKYLRVEEKVVKRECADSQVQREISSVLDAFIQRFKKTSDDEENQSEEKIVVEFPYVPIRGSGRDETVNDPESAKIEEIVCETLTIKQAQELEAAHRNRGNNFYRAKEYSEALQEYSRCLEILATPEAFNNRAITYTKLKRYQEAMDDLDQCLLRDPSNKKALLRKADIHLRRNEKSAALEVYKKLRELEHEPGEGKEFVEEQIIRLQEQLEELKVGNGTDSKSWRIPIEEDTVIGKIEEFRPNDNQEEDGMDFAKLILPKKIKPSKSQQLVDTFKEMNNCQAGEKKVRQEMKSGQTNRSLIQEM